MSEQLSPRARAILAAAEQAAVAPIGAPAVAPPASADAPPPAVAPPEAGDARPPALPPPGSGGARPPALPPPGSGDAGPPAAPAPESVAWPDPLPGSAPGQLLAIVDQIVRAAEDARRRIDELSATLEELIRRVDAAGPAADASPPPRPADPAGAQLLAVELAVSGATRLEVDRRLGDELGPRETQMLLDGIFGAGSAPDARLPWNQPAPGA